MLKYVEFFWKRIKNQQIQHENKRNRHNFATENETAIPYIQKLFIFAGSCVGIGSIPSVLWEE
jgi:hypothetical protein